MSEFKSNAINATRWQTVNTIGVNALQFVFSVVLARQILPSKFGIFAIILIICTIAQTISNGGLKEALIRRKGLTDIDLSTTFLYNVISSVILYSVIYIISPYISIYFNEPELNKALRLTAISIPINAFALAFDAKIVHSLDFKKLSIINIISVSISGIISVILAKYGYGIWALVFQYILSAILISTLTIVFSSQYPKLRFSNAKFKELFNNYGRKLMYSSVLNTIFSQIYSLITGKLWNTTQLAFYSKASNLSAQSVQIPTTIIDTISLPLLSKTQDNNDILYKRYRQLIQACAFTLFPLCLIIGALAKPIITVLLTEMWIESSKYLQILVFAFMLYPIHALNLNLLKIKGRSDLIFKLEIIKIASILCTLAITVWFGIEVMCVGQIIVSFIALICNTHYTGKILNLGIIQQLKDITPAFTLSIITFSITYLITAMIENNYLSLMLGLSVALSIYFGCAKIFKIAGYNEFKLLFLKNGK